MPRFTCSSVSSGVRGDDVNGQSKLFWLGGRSPGQVNLVLLKERSEMARLPPKRAISMFWIRPARWDPSEKIPAGPRHIWPTGTHSRIIAGAARLIYPSEAVDSHA